MNFKEEKANDNDADTCVPPYESIYQNTHDIFRSIMAKYEISTEYENKLQLLKNYKIVLLVDDSGSMKMVLEDSPLNNINSMKVTRWKEVEHFLSIAIEITNIFNEEGTDVYFLNHFAIKNAKNLDQFMKEFKMIDPNGYTTLTHALNKIFTKLDSEKPLLIIVLTDGSPTNEYGKTDLKNFKKCLKHRSPIDQLFITFVACTDDSGSVKYLNGLDKSIKNLDVVDDFRTEKVATKGQFSYGDYVAKCMLGSVDKHMDHVDERSCCFL